MRGGGSKVVWNFSVLVPRPVPNPDINFPCHLLSTTSTQFYLPEHKAMGSNAWKKLGELSAQVQNIVSKDKESGSPCKKLTCPPGTRRLIGWSLPPGEENGRNPRRTAGLKTFGRPYPSSACSLRPRSARSRSKSVGEPGPLDFVAKGELWRKSWLTCTNGTNSRQLGVGWGGAFQVWK